MGPPDVARVTSVVPLTFVASPKKMSRLLVLVLAVDLCLYFSRVLSWPWRSSLPRGLASWCVASIIAGAPSSKDWGFESLRFFFGRESLPLGCHVVFGPFLTKHRLELLIARQRHIDLFTTRHAPRSSPLILTDQNTIVPLSTLGLNCH